MLRSKPIAPRDRPLIAICYKYNARKVLYCIVTDNSVSTKTSIPYLSKHPDQFTNFAIRPVARTIVMPKKYILLMRLTPTKNQDSLILYWGSGGLTSVVG